MFVGAPAGPREVDASVDVPRAPPDLVEPRALSARALDPVTTSNLSADPDLTRNGGLRVCLRARAIGVHQPLPLPRRVVREHHKPLMAFWLDSQLLLHKMQNQGQIHQFLK